MNDGVEKKMILESRNVCKSYGKLEILKGIDLQIDKGEFVAIVGPSGAGKSTLLHILGGLDKPTKGEVLLNDENLYKLSDVPLAKIRNEKMGFIFQFYHLLEEFSALENVLLPLLIKKDTSHIKKFKKEGEAALERVGLINRMTHKPSQLSGGEQQRVAIARALINEPQILFCDEPTGNLDSQSEEEVMKVLLDLNKENNQTLMMVTHDQNIAGLSDRILKMRDGKMV